MDLVSVISQVGFPIGVATYCLVVLNKTIQKNTDVMNRLCAKLGVDATTEEKK